MGRFGRARACGALVAGVLTVSAISMGGHMVDAPPAAAVERAVPIAWRACDGAFQCGVLTVPLDWNDRASGQTVDLAVIRKPARDPRHRIGSLVFNPGGPGAPGVTFLTGVAATMPSELRDRFDLVAFDPRGVGQSDPVACEDSLDGLFDQSFQPSTTAARAALVDAMKSL